MTRLATLMVEQKEFFALLPERLMTDPKDANKPGAFLQLFPHPLSRLLIVLLWKINAVQDGDAVVLTNTWLRDFAMIDKDSLRKYRAFLQDSKVICAKPLGNGREHLYRLVNRRGKPLAGDENNADAVLRLKDPKSRQYEIRRGVIKRYKRRKHRAEVSAALASAKSSWDMIEDGDPM